MCILFLLFFGIIYKAEYNYQVRISSSEKDDHEKYIF